MPLHAPIKGDQFVRSHTPLESLKVLAIDEPEMAIRVTPGSFWVDGSLVEHSGLVSPQFTQPITVSTAKWVAVCLDKNGDIKLFDGVEDVSPEQPPIPYSHIPLAFVYVEYGSVAIFDSMIFDVRDFFTAKSAVYHSDTIGRHDPDAHNIDDITGLRAELDLKTTIYDLNSKADIYGTTNHTFELNNNALTAYPHASITVNRGPTNSKPAIRWNEFGNRWEFTSDGVAWYAFVGQDPNANNANPTGARTLAGTTYERAAVVPNQYITTIPAGNLAQVCKWLFTVRETNTPSNISTGEVLASTNGQELSHSIFGYQRLGVGVRDLEINVIDTTSGMDLQLFSATQSLDVSVEVIYTK